MNDIIKIANEIANTTNNATNFTNIQNSLPKTEQQIKGEVVEMIYQKHLQAQEWGNKLNQKSQNKSKNSWQLIKERIEKLEIKQRKKRNIFSDAWEWTKGAAEDSVNWVGTAAKDTGNWVKNAAADTASFMCSAPSKKVDFRKGFGQGVKGCWDNTNAQNNELDMGVGMNNGPETTEEKILTTGLKVVGIAGSGGRTSGGWRQKREINNHEQHLPIENKTNFVKSNLTSL